MQQIVFVTKFSKVVLSKSIHFLESSRDVPWVFAQKRLKLIRDFCKILYEFSIDLHNLPSSEVHYLFL